MWSLKCETLQKMQEITAPEKCQFAFRMIKFRMITF